MRIAFVRCLAPWTWSIASSAIMVVTVCDFSIPSAFVASTPCGRPSSFLGYTCCIGVAARLLSNVMVAGWGAPSFVRQSWGRFAARIAPARVMVSRPVCARARYGTVEQYARPRYSFGSSTRPRALWADLTKPDILRAPHPEITLRCVARQIGHYAPVRGLRRAFRLTRLRVGLHAWTTSTCFSDPGQVQGPA